jgi:hypothetical protein
MKLHLAVPSSGTVGVLRLHHLQPFPIDQDAWMSQTLSESLPPQASLAAVATREHRTTYGWPMRIVEAKVIDKDQQTIELRIAAYYRFLDYCAAAVVSGLSPSRIAEDRAAVTALFESATPNWQDDEVVALVDLWDQAVVS